MPSKSLYPYLISLASVAAIVVYASSFLSKISHDYSEQNRILSQLADERAKKISAALEEERRQHAQIMSRMQLEYERNREEYERKLKEFEEKKKKDIAAFVDGHGDNPKGMAEALAKSTGFKVYDGK